MAHSAWLARSMLWVEPSLRFPNLKHLVIPKTTFTVGTVEGGTSVNSIAADGIFAIDLRSNDREELALLEQKAKDAANEAVAEENARWN